MRCGRNKLSPFLCSKGLVAVGLPVLTLALLFPRAGRASITGTISGIVTDSSGAVIPVVSVTAVNTRTGVKQTTRTDSQGFYSFQELPIGEYEIVIEKEGFKKYQQTGLVIDVNSALRVDAVLQVGAVSQEVTVSSTALHVETTSTQQGEVITGSHMTTLPLNGRSYTDLLALQPGVAPQSSGEYITYTNSANSVSGSLNAGGLSINGQRETANGFTVNGADVNESIYQQTSIIPNLDSIAEFRILTSNFNAEYGNYSGGQIMVVTKSGTNQFHGDLFEFLRNDDFDSRNFFSPTRGSFKQNQFGGTLGGPIRRDKAFFFADYQGTRNVIGQDTGNILVPSAADRTGDFSDKASSFYTVSNGQAVPNTVKGSSWASTLSQELGYPVTAGEPYYIPGCANSSQCVFPNATIPQSAFSSPATHLLQYIPLANSGPFFTTSAYSESLRDDKGGARYDQNTRWGMISAYYMLDDYTLVNPYATSSLPGFSDQNAGRAQLIELGDTTSLGGSALNELRLSFMRNAIFENKPVSGQGLGVSFSAQGFAEGFNTLGLGVIAPQYVGVLPIGLNEFSFGISANTTKQFDNIYQVQDSYSKVLGTHTLKFGGSFHYDQAGLLWPNLTSDGNFGFNGYETGSDFADFLIGAPVFFAQGAPNGFPNRSHYIGLYGQDSWRATRNLTLNYGLRWDVSQFWYSPRNEVDAMIPGEQSVDLPGTPTGLLFPGDPGVPRTVAPTGYHNFGPRIGLAYSSAATGGILKAITGGAGKSSIRVGYGLFFTEIEDLSVQIQTDYPFGLYYVSPVPPLFATPYVDRATGHSEGQRFPVAFPPPPSPSHPDTSVNWAQFEPIASNPVVYGGDRLPYSEDYTVSVQRQFGSNTVVALNYVGAQGHRLLTGLEANPGDPAVCLSVSQASQVMPGTPTCGPFGENGTYYPANGGVINGTRTPFGSLFASNAWYDTMGNSNYNGFEATVREASGRAEFLASYTYSKAMDNASGLGDQIYPFDYKLTKALSAFDTTNNFVISYAYTVPFEKLFGHNRVAGGWRVAGISRFASGFPVTLNEQDDNSLLGTGSSGIGGGVDVPDYRPGDLKITNPRTGLPYFNTSLFSPEAIGHFGTANRRFFHGPGINNFDMTLLKDFRLTESKTLEFRAEWFNIFNHAQFAAPNGDINSGTFGLVTSANAPRIGQLALKLNF